MLAPQLFLPPASVPHALLPLHAPLPCPIVSTMAIAGPHHHLQPAEGREEGQDPFKLE